jgi:uncharacterized protein DUF6624
MTALARLRRHARSCVAIVSCETVLTSNVVLVAITAVQIRAAVAEPALRAELVQLGRDDQAAREGLADAIKSNNAVFGKTLTDGDAARTKRLKEIVAAYGWPTGSLIGQDGVDAAWLILQHSPDSPWQEEMLPRLQAASETGDIPRADVALLTDRVLVHAGRPQRYGSSFSVVNGHLVAEAIEDEITVDSRRAAVGLPPMAEYALLLADLYRCR